MHEVCVYTPHPDNPQHTTLSVTARLSVTHIFLVSARIEKQLLANYVEANKNARKFERPLLEQSMGTHEWCIPR